ncbi:hypothetical protein Pcinc_039647 [Petrolisthes cinctipes]|uniref:Uncharacterized protein n=1 Tax=Petrolisthes cinctipes TaxID=88211 RepID=A0AAE1EIX5_PETCI|nr:hypothetical protein Pcinc_039647 [Petrolisthes cinctipes]
MARHFGLSRVPSVTLMFQAPSSFPSTFRVKNLSSWRISELKNLRNPLYFHIPLFLTHLLSVSSLSTFPPPHYHSPLHYLLPASPSPLFISSLPPPHYHSPLHYLLPASPSPLFISSLPPPHYHSPLHYLLPASLSPLFISSLPPPHYHSPLHYLLPASPSPLFISSLPPPSFFSLFLPPLLHSSSSSRLYSTLHLYLFPPSLLFLPLHPASTPLSTLHLFPPSSLLFLPLPLASTPLFIFISSLLPLFSPSSSRLYTTLHLHLFPPPSFFSLFIPPLHHSPSSSLLSLLPPFSPSSSSLSSTLHHHLFPPSSLLFLPLPLASPPLFIFISSPFYDLHSTSFLFFTPIALCT